MISIIICSRKKDISEEFKKNIASTIKFNYELLIIDNSKNDYSIFEAYNKGISLSEGELLCFAHEDIWFHSTGWGEILDEIFNNDSNIGLLGIAGTKFKTKAPSGWANCPNDMIYMNLIQLNEGQKQLWQRGFNTKNLEKVVAVDGLFMVMRKSTNVFFNTSLKGFHNYDVAISLDIIASGYTVVVTNRILVEHFSMGSFKKDWIESTDKFYRSYESFLPKMAESGLKTTKQEISNFKRFIRDCIKIDNFKLAFFYWRKLMLHHPIAFFHIQFQGVVAFKFCFYLFKKIFYF